jgi:hypothetical protein
MPSEARTPSTSHPVSAKKKIGRTVMAKQLTDVFERSRASFR